jgi:hypothetical protein
MKEARTGTRPAILTALVFCFALLLPLTAVEAQVILKPIRQDSWAGWENLGGTTGFGPECISTKPNTIDCFTISGSAQVSRTSWNGSSWTNPPQAVSGLFPSNRTGVTTLIPLRMECVSWGPDHIDCFTKDDNGALWRRTWDGTYDHGWQNLGGNIGSVPDCVATALRQLECFARATNGGLAHITFDGNIWSAWTTYAGNILEGTKPECVAYINNRIECMVVYPDLKPRHFSVRSPWRGFVDTGWGNLISTGTGYASAPRTPVCRTEPGTDRLACFGPWSMTSVLTGNLISSFGMWEYNPQYDSWNFIDLTSDYGKGFFSQPTGLVAYDFDCLMLPNGRIHCMELAVRSPLGSPNTATRTTLLRHLVWDRNLYTYSGWVNYLPSSAPTPTPSMLGCVSWGGDRLDCFATGAPLDPTAFWHAWFVPYVRPIHFP